MNGPRTTAQSAAGRSPRERQTDQLPPHVRKPTEDAKPAAAKSARTVKELMARIDQQYDHLKTLVLWLVKHQQTAKRQRVAAAGIGPTDTESTASRLVASLSQAVDCLESLLQSPTETSECQSAFVRDITRALVLSGHGSQLDLTVESVIRNYCEARLDVQRYSRHDDLPEAVRQDIVAGFTRVMEGHRIELQLLGVELEEVQPGATLDREIHEVAKQVASPSVEQIDTVRDCLSPLFRWKNGDGVQRIKPARVIVNAEKKRSASTPQRGQRVP